MDRYLYEAILAGGCIALPLLARIAAVRERLGEITLLLIAISAASAGTMNAEPHLLAHRTLAADPFAIFTKFLISLIALAVVWLSTRAREAELGRNAISWPLFLASMLGLDLLATGMHVVTLWAGFELATIGCAGWIASRRESGMASVLPQPESQASDLEHAVLLQGMAASATMLLGFALLFALGGTLELMPLAGKLVAAVSAPGGRVALATASLLVIAGMLSRLSMLPWLMLRASISEASSLPTAAWMQVGWTVAGLAMLVRFVRCTLSVPEDPTSWSVVPGTEWPWVLATLSISTTIAAFVAALRATDLRRFLSWMIAAQSGYLVLGLVVAENRGVQASMFESVAFAVTSLGALAALSLVMESGGPASFDALRGFARRRGGRRVAIPLAVFVLSLGGIWPTAGYTGRSWILTVLLRADLGSVVAMAALGSFLGVLCCVRFVATMLESPPDPDEAVAVDFEAGLLVALLVVATLALGLGPDPLASFVARSVVFFGG